MQPVVRFHVFEAGQGFCGIAWTASGIRRFQLQSATAEAAAHNMRRHEPGAEAGAPTGSAADAIERASRYFEGAPTSFAELPLDLAGRDAFFQRVYAWVRQLAWGQTATYGTVAKALGEGPEAARDVGQAMARNPIALIIPCHRVLAAGGKLGGFSAPQGPAQKLRMLALEGLDLDRPRAAPPQQSLPLDF